MKIGKLKSSFFSSRQIMGKPLYRVGGMEEISKCRGTANAVLPTTTRMCGRNLMWKWIRMRTCILSFAITGEWEQWQVVYPEETAMMTSSELRKIALIARLGVAGAMVPGPMTAFGTVVAGLGTFHAFLAVGGVAATLQATSSALVTGGAAVVGASVGAAAGAACSS